MLREIIEKAQSEEEFCEMLVDRKDELSPKHIITEDIIASITEENITVTVDFSQEQAGTASLKAMISVNVDGVGAVGTYNVTATVKAK